MVITMMEWMVYLLANFFRIYLVRKFIYVLLGEVKQEKRIEILAYGAFFLVNSGLYIIFNQALINIINNILGIGLMVFLYTKSIRANLFVTCSICLVGFACDTVTALLFANNKAGREFNQTYAILTVFLVFVCLLLSEKIVNHKKNSDAVQNLPLISVPLCSIAIIIFMIYRRQEVDIEMFVINIGLLMINFLVFYLYNMLLKSITQKYDHEILRKKVQAYSNQINIILQNEEEVRTLRHDMKHHMNELKLLAKENDSAAIENYIDSMEEFIHNPNELVASGNLEIDSVLNYMLQRAKQEQCSVKVRTQITEAISHSFDINIILGNLLENAIEAARKTEERRLEVSVVLEQGVLRVEIINSINEAMRNRHNGEKGLLDLSTTKAEKKRHGIGLKSVRKIVEKYDGIMKIFIEDNLFHVKLVLYMPEMKNEEKN